MVYKDKKMFFTNSRHNVPKLIRLGFLLCRHYSPETQVLEMWHIINPKLDDHVTPGQVKTFLEDLLYVAIDMNLNILNANEGDNSAESQKAKNYLEECLGKKEAFLNSFMSGLNEPITKETLGGKLKKDFFDSYRLRMAVGGREIQPVKP